jgi:hypothetical protein
MRPLDLVRLGPLMELTGGRPDLVIGLIDGPVRRDHPDLAGVTITELPGMSGIACTQPDSVACQHGTFVAGILSAKRGSPAPAICPSCALLVCPIFAEDLADAEMPTAHAEELAGAILDSIRAGARILNPSAAISQPSSKSERSLTDALDQACRRGVLLVAAAGNQ